jgi:hypothetical protein
MVLHNMPAGAAYRYLAVVTKGPDYETTVSSLDPGLQCAAAMLTCEAWHAFRVPISAFQHSGLQELRLRGGVSPIDGNSLRPSLNWMTYVWNGKSRADTVRMPYLRAKGWYTGLNYCEAAYRSDATPLPDGAVAVPWSPWLRQPDHGSSDADPTYWSIRLDPNLHMGVSGAFLGQGTGQRDGRFTVDAPSGAHRLFLQTECETSQGAVNGILVLPFTAGRSPLSPPAPPPSPPPGVTPQPPGPPPAGVTPPNTRISTRPRRTTTGRRAVFRFLATEAGSTFRCKLDRRLWRPCASPKRYRNLRFGRHTFRVRATDRAGNVDPTPAVWRWRIRRAASARHAAL